MASGAIETSGSSAIVDVLRTIRPSPSVDADTRESAVRVGAGGPVFANTGPQSALVHVLVAIRASEGRRTLARIRVDSVHATGSVLAQMTWAVVDILLTISTGETCTGSDKILIKLSLRKRLKQQVFHEKWQLCIDMENRNSVFVGQRPGVQAVEKGGRVGTL